MTLRSFIIEPLASRHERTGFSCGVAPLDRYLREQARQDVRRHIAACYVAMEDATGKIGGYYTLAASGILLGDMPAALAKRLPRYPSVPVARLGRLAVDLAFQGQKLGSALLWDAIMRSLRSEIAVFGLVVDAKDEKAESFYRHHKFVAFAGETRQLILSLANLSSLPDR